MKYIATPIISPQNTSITECCFKNRVERLMLMVRIVAAYFSRLLKQFFVSITAIRHPMESYT